MDNTVINLLMVVYRRTTSAQSPQDAFLFLKLTQTSVTIHTVNLKDIAFKIWPIQSA